MRVVCIVLYTTSLMMLVRCIVRTIEQFESASCDVNFFSFCGPVHNYEWYLWVFEVSNITVFIAALAIWNPARYLPNDYKTFLDPVDGRTERLGPGFKEADKRPLVLTVLDPFNFAACCVGKGTGLDPFWEREWPARETSFADRRIGKVEKVDAAQKA